MPTSTRAPKAAGARDGWQQQYLHADRADRAGGPGMQEREPDRGFAKRLEDQDLETKAAVLEAARLHLRSSP